MSETLSGDQWPKGVSEEQVRVIVQDELANFFAYIRNAVTNIPLRSDGNINGSDFARSLEIVEEQYRADILAGNLSSKSTSSS